VNSLTEALLARVAEPDQPVPLLDAALIVEKLTGQRVHRSALHRWESKGTGGVRLEVLRVGKTRMVTARLLAQFFVAAGAARNAQPTPGPKKKKAPRRLRVRRGKVESQAANVGGST